MDTVLQEIGSCGRFQFFHVIVLQLSRFSVAWAKYVMVFGLYNPGWRCGQTNISTSENNLYSSTTPSTSPEVSSDNSQMPPLLSYNYENFSTVSVNPQYHNIMHESIKDKIVSNLSDTIKSTYYYNGTCDMIDSCERIEFDSMSSTIVSEFGLLCDKVWIAYFIVSVQNIGALIGGLLWGYIGERFGRKIPLYGSTLIMAMSCGLAVLSPNWQVYAVFTLIIGFGSTGVMSLYSILCMEFLTSKWRGRLGSVPIWNVGIVCFSLASYLLRDWRYIHLTAAAICLIACLGFFWVPESIRWLVVHGKLSEAEKSVYTIAIRNKRTVRIETIEHLIEAESKSIPDKEYTYLDLFRHREIRVPVLKLCLIMVVSVLVYDVIAFAIQALPGDFYTNMILDSVYAIPVCLISGPLVNKLGRRTTGVLYSSIGTICCGTNSILFLLMEEGSVRDTLISTLAFVTKSAMQGLIGCVIVIFASELIPTAVRSLAFGFFTFPSRIATMFGVFLLPRDNPSMIAFFFLLMFAHAMMTASFWSLPETKNKPLKDEIDEVRRSSGEADL